MEVKVPDRSKTRKASLLYLSLCLCCVWLSPLFSSGRLRAKIKVRVALNMDLYCSTHTHSCYLEDAITHILFDSRKNIKTNTYTKRTENNSGVVCLCQTPPPPSQVHGTTKFLLLETAVHLASSKDLAFTPGGNIPRFCNGVSPLGACLFRVS